MFVIEWLFDKMGYTKKIDWTSSSLTWEMVNLEPNDAKVTVRKPAKKKPAVKKTVKSRAKKD